MIRFQSIYPTGPCELQCCQIPAAGVELQARGRRRSPIHRPSLINSAEAMMRQVNMDEAKTQLSRLVDEAAAEDSFVICKAGKPMVQVTPLSGAQASPPAKRRLGLLLREYCVPDDFDRIDADAIASLFEGA